MNHEHNHPGSGGFCNNHNNNHNIDDSTDQNSNHSKDRVKRDITMNKVTQHH